MADKVVTIPPLTTAQVAACQVQIAKLAAAKATLAIIQADQANITVNVAILDSRGRPGSMTLAPGDSQQKDIVSTLIVRLQQCIKDSTAAIAAYGVDPNS